MLSLCASEPHFLVPQCQCLNVLHLYTCPTVCVCPGRRVPHTSQRIECLPCMIILSHPSSATHHLDVSSIPVLPQPYPTLPRPTEPLLRPIHSRLFRAHTLIEAN
ncbi:hypothetical protein E2C01_100261 [Portunus trituberculatus]|uniref:Uncharacterized protein n=1 Tax=Portunus trituberculatus TaxID=210409 RepID=A0A5B7KD39_PORTR|nr:hypothetical protein [Portunus trituberculatus]